MTHITDVKISHYIYNTKKTQNWDRTWWPSKVTWPHGPIWPKLSVAMHYLHTWFCFFFFILYNGYHYSRNLSMGRNRSVKEKFYQGTENVKCRPLNDLWKSTKLL